MSLSLHCISRNDVSKDTNFAIISAAVEVEAALGVEAVEVEAALGTVAEAVGVVVALGTAAEAVGVEAALGVYVCVESLLV